MVEAVTQFKTFDGKVFADEGQAEQWERDTNKANAIKSMFPNNGHLYSGDFYRLPMQLIADARRKLADALNGDYPDHAIKSFVDNTGDIIGRFLSDNNSPFYKAWWIFECIDDQGRMFNQPYFANNSEKAENEVAY